MQDKRRRKIESLFTEYCFKLGPSELMVNPILIELAQITETILFSNQHWTMDVAEEAIQNFLNAVSPTHREKSALKRIESQIVQMMNHLKNYQTQLVA